MVVLAKKPRGEFLPLDEQPIEVTICAREGRLWAEVWGNRYAAPPPRR
jgi:hypothetical protein